MPFYAWKLPYLLIGLALGYMFLREGTENGPETLLLFALPLVLFASLWIKRKERILLSIALIDISLHIDRSFGPEESFLVTRWGYLVSLTFIALAGLYVLQFLKSYLYNESRPAFASFPKLNILVGCYLVSVICSFLSAYDLYIGSYEVFYQIQCILLYLYLVYYIDDESKLKFVIYILLAGFVFQSVVVFIQSATGVEFDFISGSKSNQMTKHLYPGNLEIVRPSGTFQSYNILADYLTTLLFLTLGFLFAQKNQAGRIVIGVCFAFGMAALLMTYSRGGWAGFALGLSVFFMVGLRYRWVTLKAGFGLLLVGVLTILPFSTRIFYRLTESDGGAGLSRIPLAKLAWNIIVDHPFFGVGVNNFGLVMQDYITSDIRGEWLFIVHNKFLLIFAEMGLIGIASFLALMIGITGLCYRCVKAGHPLLSPLALGIMASLVCDTLHMMVDILQARSSVETFWVLAALAVAASRLIDLEQARSSSGVASRSESTGPFSGLYPAVSGPRLS